jgi:hypothetical protein
MPLVPNPELSRLGLRNLNAMLHAMGAQPLSESEYQNLLAAKKSLWINCDLQNINKEEALK